MAKKVESIKHKTDTRAHIPSKEEAGYEDANAKVQDGKKVLELPKNPVVHRGQDPELFWLNKYGNDDRDDLLRVDIRSLYRHEHIAPETLIKNLYNVTETKSDQMDLFSVNELFGNALDKDEIEKVSEYYHHQDGWTNRLIQGDSHLVMASLLEREGMAGQVQMMYFDPPYGINYGSNWQVKLGDRTVKESDEDLAGEPEVIKAFRDTWELGIHSYLTYLRDRLIIAKELLTDSGSCFVQISSQNSHLVRNLMDEVFGSENFMNQISFQTKIPLGTKYLSSLGDIIIWYAKNKDNVKYRQLYTDRKIEEEFYNLIELPNGKIERFNPLSDIEKYKVLKGRPFRILDLVSSGSTQSCIYEFEFEGQVIPKPKNGKSWKTTKTGMETLIKNKRLIKNGKAFGYKLYLDDYPVRVLDDVWKDTVNSFLERKYVVQTNPLPIQRCMLMTTDPGDLVLDPTCGSGTTAYVAEHWGRRWITIDTSRIALNIAKQRMMKEVFPYFELYDKQNSDVRFGFNYKKVPHITLGSIANNEPSENETMYDQPIEDKSKLRVSGPFTVETLQNFEPVSPEELDDEVRVNEEEGAFEEVIKQHLISAGIKNGRKDEMVVFRSVELLSHSYLHAEGFYMNGVGEKKAYFHIGPKFGTVSKTAVNEAIKECRSRGDAGWLIILGFSFESDIEGGSQTKSMGTFQVDKVRIHDDLLQEGLKKKPAKSAASFVTIGEPDIDLNIKGNEATVEIKGLDIYDPIKDEVKPRNVHDIAYWMVDEDYDGSNFVVKQVFFCGGDKSEFDKWKKGLDNLAKDSTKKKVEKTLKIEIDDEAFDRLYGHISHPIEIKKKGQKIAVRIISQFGEECTKVLTA